MDKLIYIMGAGRSGTTLLDIVLGNCANSISLGEVRDFPKYEGKAVGRKEESPVYSFWQNIYEKLEECQETEKWKDPLNRMAKIEYHYALPIAIMLHFTRCIFIERYKRFWENMFKTISRESKRRVLIDSSKYPGRAMLLSSFLPQFCCIYIIRNKAAVVKSFKKTNIEQPPKNKYSATLYYLLMRISCGLCFLIIRRPKVKVRYEYFVHATSVVVKEIAKRFEINCADLDRKLRLNDSLRTGYQFNGNRIRLQDDIFIEREQ